MVSDFRLVKLLFNNFATFTIGILALLAAYYCAKYTAEFYRKDQQVAGITGLISYLFVCMVNVSEKGDGIINLPVDAMMLGGKRNPFRPIGWLHNRTNFSKVWRH